jgi:hypothetical protein
LSWSLHRAELASLEILKGVTVSHRHAFFAHIAAEYESGNQSKPVPLFAT